MKIPPIGTTRSLVSFKYRDRSFCQKNFMTAKLGNFSNVHDFPEKEKLE